MVLLGRWRGYSLTLSFKSNCLTLSLQDANTSTVCSFDGTGRLWTALFEAVSYRRGLDGKIVAKWQTADNGRDRRWLSPAETQTLQENARELAVGLLSDLAQSTDILSAPPAPADSAMLQRAAGFTTLRYAADIAAYRKVYLPVGILPPDQYMGVVLQAAEGCSFNTCTFCNFYKDRHFRIKTPQQFRAHASAVKDFLGAGLSLRRTIFLGDANSLVIPMPRLLPLIDITHELFDVDRLGGIYAFLDGFSAEKKTAQDYALLAQRGLKRVYIGMETGHDALLQFLKKPGSAADAIQSVRAMKAGGVSVGLILLLGAGGKQYSQAHVRDTVAALNQMDLDADDLLYFSELVEDEGMQYTRDAYAQSLIPLSSPERIAQGDEIEGALHFSSQGGTPHISRTISASLFIK
jgi:hypothetical protein